MGFVCGRDAVVFTTHRAIQIDTQWLGSKVLYLSLPWTAIKTYKVQSAGTWDLDAEMKLGIYAPWYNQEVGPGLTIDFSRGRCDILAVNTFLSCQTIGAADGTSTIAREVLPPCPEGPIGELFSWLGDCARRCSNCVDRCHARRISCRICRICRNSWCWCWCWCWCCYIGHILCYFPSPFRGRRFGRFGRRRCRGRCWYFHRGCRGRSSRCGRSHSRRSCSGIDRLGEHEGQQ